MPILRTSELSPYGRKVKIAAKLTGHYADLAFEEVNTRDPDEPIREQNPLGKIPTLILDDGTALYDSRVICAYFDAHSKGARLVPDGAAQWPVLRLQALADGMMDAGLLVVMEDRFRPDALRSDEWKQYQREKIDRGLTALVADPPAVSATPTLGEIAVACILGYLDVRFEGAWRASHPKLVDWLDAFAEAVPAFGETAPRV